MLKNSQTYLKHLALFTITITLLNNNNNKRELTNLNSCSKSKMETPKQCVKSV